mmetsp:Transcript_47446/g.80973  ORF Transcript_47446/g.80973 Transcript_47446/m.80973 type:complete len:160 (+) Transcript_47446:162-641(+)
MASSILIPPDRDRFIAELEFVQCLSSPGYIHYLAQNKYFDKPGFNNFLVYLRYWKKPEYSKFLRYPICLAFLDILTEDSEISRTFRTEIAKAEFQDFVHGQVFNHWQHSKAARMRDMEDIPFCSNMVGSVFQGSERATEGARFLHPRTDIADAQSPLSP